MKPANSPEKYEPLGRTCAAFASSRCIASGDLKDVAANVRQLLDLDKSASVLIFDDTTSEVIEVDFRGTVTDVLRKLGARRKANGHPTAKNLPGGSSPRAPGRPKLGVIAREITLLPRHWDWLGSQPGGASVALRKLVEVARHANAGKDRERQAREATYNFMSVTAGNEPGFEEATRALFAGNRQRFDQLVTAWPPDVRDHAKKLAAIAFQDLRN
ncbi:MAG: DUF2239 family protein [Pedosphaera sp.]|nr:DUF2239 family protein [Pedosphaera sp.]